MGDLIDILRAGPARSRGTNELIWHLGPLGMLAGPGALAGLEKTRTTFLEAMTASGLPLFLCPPEDPPDPELSVWLRPQPPGAWRVAEGALEAQAFWQELNLGDWFLYAARAPSPESPPNTFDTPAVRLVDFMRRTGLVYFIDSFHDDTEWMMGKRDIEAAVRLMEKAWTTRWEMMRSPPASKTELQRTVEEVRRDLVEAVAICREIGAGPELVHALRKLGHVEQDSGHKEATRELYEEAVAVSRRLGDPLLLAHSVRHLGDIHRAGGRVEPAETCYNEALALYRDHGSRAKLDHANAIRPMAILKEDAGMVDDAAALWREARDLYAKVGVQEGVEECSNHLRDLGVESGS